MGSDLPVPVDETRSYVQVHPTTDPLAIETLTTHVHRLYGLASAEEPEGLRARLLSDTQPATIECLLVSHGDDTPLTYLFGIDDPDRLDALERILRGLFPDSYEFTRTREHPDRLTTAGDDQAVTGIEYAGCVDRPRDWQTQLTPFSEFQPDPDARVPLATLVECMADTQARIVYQVLIRPKPDWTAAASATRRAIEYAEDTVTGQVINTLIGRPEEPLALDEADEIRREEIAARETRRSFDCTVRAAVIGPATQGTETPSDDSASASDADTDAFARVARELAELFEPVSRTCYAIEGRTTTGAAGRTTLQAIHERTHTPPSFERVAARLTPGAIRSPGIVADAAEVASFWLFGGATLTTAASRLVAPTPGERTSLPRPPVDQLAHYRGDGMPLGAPLTQDGTPDDEPLVLPPALQPLHVGWFGKTGSGKSTSLITAILENHAATDGADILIDPKGDGMTTDYLRAHYATYGTLENVVYFDCATTLPAFGFFDIREELAAGVSRTAAVEDAVDHYLEILTQIMGRDRFEQAVRSPDIIRYLTKAMFDPVNGYDAFSHRDLQGAVRTMHERQAAPAVSDPDLERMLAGVVANRARSFDEIMQGVANRIEKIPVDQRLARMFNHVPDAGDPHFDLADYLNEDVVIIFETGELRTEAQRVLTLVVLSNLWTALKRRAQRDGSDHPLVNLYIEEAASIAVSDLLSALLAQSRSFDCSVTLAMQFPAQIRAHSEAAYDEVLNDINTFVTGNVPVDPRLAERLATDEMTPQDVGNRLRALRRGQWLCAVPAPFDEPEPRPFLVGSLAPPPGDSAGSRPLTPADERAFLDALAATAERTLAEAGLAIDTPTVVPHEDGTTHDSDTGVGDADQDATPLRVDSALPHTKRLPPTVAYDRASHALRCRECDNRYDPDITGMQRAIACCSALEAVDGADVPICELNLKLTPEERDSSEWSDRQLIFLQAVYNAQQLRYAPLEYDLLWDSMLRLQEYTGINTDAVQDLIDADLLRHDTDHPHRLYSVTPAGRSVIGESYRQGVDYGHGQGDLDESSAHVLGIEILRQFLTSTYRDDPDSPVTEIIPYFEVDDTHRLDVAGLDADGTVIIAAEMERINHDLRTAAPADFDKMAACDPDEAIWVVMSHADGHEVLAALNDPADGRPRVGKTYASTSPVGAFRIDKPGFTRMYTVEQLRDRLPTDVK